MIDKDEILALTQEGLDIFSHYLGIEVNTHKNFLSPFYEDTKPSCHIYYDKVSNVYRFYDHGNPQYSGDCFWFASEILGLNLKQDFPDILKTIIRDLRLPITIIADECSPNRKRNVVDYRPKAKVEKERNRPYSIELEPFSSSLLNYWLQYGITESTLMRYNVANITCFNSVNSEGRSYSIKASALEPIFAYQGKGFVKLYRPNSNKMRFMYAGELPESYCFGIEQLPSKGDILFITGGEKDVMSLYAHGFHAICFNSETIRIPRNVIESLSLRFRHIILLYDVDDTGIRESERELTDLAEFGVLRLLLPLSGSKLEKDISDYFSSGFKSSDLRALLSKLFSKFYYETKMMMHSCEIDSLNPPEIAESIVSINEVPLGTQGNLLCITGGEGTGKSNYVSAIISGAIVSNGISASIEDTLGLSVTPNYNHKAVLHYDTEQSESQLYKNLKRTLKRVGLVESPPFLHTFYLASFSRKDRLKLIRDSMDLYYHQYSGIHLVVIDGIADLIRSANDEAESIAIVDELYRLAGIYNTCIITVLHFVPNGLKLRGHIGSELQRKSAGILSVEKDDDPSLSVVKTLKVRDGSPLDVPLTLFGWDKSKNMHVYRGEKSCEDKQKRKIDELAYLSNILFRNCLRLSYSELCSGIMAEMDVKDRTAKKYISFMKEAGIIKQDSSGQYIKG